MQQIKIGKILSIIVAALLMMGNTYGSLGQQDLSSVDQRRLLLVSIPGLSFQEIDELHGFGWEQLLRGRVAAMNVRTPERGIEDVYLSVGSGAPAVAWTHTQAMMSDEQVGTVLAKDMVVRYTGRTIAGEIVIPTWVEMKQFNENLANSALPGLLGETLKRANIARYVLGNRDQVFLPENNEQAIFRHAPLLLADLHGEVSYGLIGQAANMANDLRPHGLQTNYEALLHALEELDDRAVIVVELGDLDRLYAEKGRMSQKQFLQMKHVVLHEMGEFLELLMHEHLRQTDELWVLSPMSHAVARQGKSLLTPFFQLGEAGELTSGTTRQAGLISYVDLSVSILDWFGLSVPETMRGQPIQSVQEESTLADTLIKVDEIEYVYKLRPKLIYPLVTYQMLALLLGLAFLLWRAKFSSKMMLSHHKVRYFHKVICALLYSAVLSPFVLLFVGPWRQIDQTILIFLFYLFIISVSWLLSRFPVVGTLSLIGFVTAGGILLDGSLGSPLMKQSVLGYDPIIGARYYGVGNEYMGALIGAAILAFATLHESISKHVGRRLSLIFAACLYGAVIIFLASPAFGTNAGGAISASVAFAAFFIILLRRHKQIRVRTVATVGGVGLVVALSSLWVLNSLLDSASSTPSHIGKAFDHLFAGRFKLIYDIIHRKIAMNLHLMGVSSWSKLLTAGLIVIVGLSLYSRSRHYQQWTRENPSVSSGLTSILFGAVTAFVMNDSGLVAAAMMIIYIAVPMLLMHLGYRSDSHSANSGSN